MKEEKNGTPAKAVANSTESDRMTASSTTTPNSSTLKTKTTQRKKGKTKKKKSKCSLGSRMDKILILLSLYLIYVILFRSQSHTTPSLRGSKKTTPTLARLPKWGSTSPFPTPSHPKYVSNVYLMYTLFERLFFLTVLCLFLSLQITTEQSTVPMFQ